MLEAGWIFKSILHRLLKQMGADPGEVEPLLRVDLKFGGAGVEGAVGKDACAETAAPLEEFFHAESEGLIHPVAGSTFLAAVKGGVADTEGFADEGIEVDTTGKDVAAEHLGCSVMALQGVLCGMVDGFVEECDLTLVIFLELVVSVAHKALAGDALDGIGREHRVVAPGLAVVAREVVFGRQVDGDNFNLHFLQDA